MKYKKKKKERKKEETYPRHLNRIDNKINRDKEKGRNRGKGNKGDKREREKGLFNITYGISWAILSGKERKKFQQRKKRYINAIFIISSLNYPLNLILQSPSPPHEEQFKAQFLEEGEENT